MEGFFVQYIPVNNYSFMKESYTDLKIFQFDILLDVKL